MRNEGRSEVILVLQALYTYREFAMADLLQYGISGMASVKIASLE